MIIVNIFCEYWALNLPFKCIIVKRLLGHKKNVKKAMPGFLFLHVYVWFVSQNCIWNHPKSYTVIKYSLRPFNVKHKIEDI